jgi:CubicO group peptidase (beta-lactamase class C family)
VYSNSGYTLLALIIEKVSGKSYRAYLASKILRLPDGAVAGGFWNGEPAAPGPRAVGRTDDGRTGERGDFTGPHWALDGNGGWAMTGRDLAAWTHALFTGKVLSARSMKTLGTLGYDLGEGRRETPGWVAFDRTVYGVPFLATAGGGGDEGHDTVAVWLPGTRRVIAIASNRPEITAEALLKALAPALLAGDPLPTPSAPVGGGDTAATVGRYRLKTGGVFDVTASGDRVSISASGADAVAALFAYRGVPAGDVRGHEARVRSLLAGETDEGRAERSELESSLGPVREVTLAGTISRDGELRTYVTLTAGSGQVRGWYAVNAEGGIDAVQVPAEPPALPLVPAGGVRYRPDDPTGSGPDISVEFHESRLTISGPAGTTSAQRVQ